MTMNIGSNLKWGTCRSYDISFALTIRSIQNTHVCTDLTHDKNDRHNLIDATFNNISIQGLSAKTRRFRGTASDFPVQRPQTPPLMRTWSHMVGPSIITHAYETSEASGSPCKDNCTPPRILAGLQAKAPLPTCNYSRAVLVFPVRFSGFEGSCTCVSGCCKCCKAAPET